jgi:hypothetical protein
LFAVFDIVLLLSGCFALLLTIPQFLLFVHGMRPFTA